jgi:hypothetical protein
MKANHPLIEDEYQWWGMNRDDLLVSPEAKLSNRMTSDGEVGESNGGVGGEVVPT